MAEKPRFTRHDFTAVGTLVLNFPLVLVPYDSPWKTLTDLINDCKAKPSIMPFSSVAYTEGAICLLRSFLKIARITARHVFIKEEDLSLSRWLANTSILPLIFFPLAFLSSKANKLRGFSRPE